MITVDAAGRIRLSREASRGAGFRPGQKIAVVAEGQNSFRIQSAAKTSKVIQLNKMVASASRRQRFAHLV
jgi:hypothetical protein